MKKLELELKVARAIYAVSCAEADDGEGHSPCHWGRLAPVTQDIYLKMAKAAIEVMTGETS